MHAAARFVGLTGSTEVGKILYGRACIGLKKLGLELAPFVEFEAPISMPPSRAPSSPNTATWTRPASAPIASTHRQASMRNSSEALDQGRGIEIGEDAVRACTLSMSGAIAAMVLSHNSGLTAAALFLRAYGRDAVQH